jgi:CheY-like chemotaxis protein
LRAAAAQGPRWQYDLVVVDSTEPAPRIAAFTRSVLGDTVLANARLVLLTHPDADAAAIATSPRTASLPRAFVPPQLRAVLDDVFDAGAAQVRAEAHRSAMADDDVALPRVGEAAPRPLRGRVLLVEDNAVNLQVARRLLGLHGLTVDSAGDGEEALSRLAAADYDLVLMDCQMPRMDGYTATQRWRASEGERGVRAIPIVAMTANAMAGDREKCLAAGMSDYLSKPLSRPRLEQILLRWLVADAAAPAPAAESTGEIASERAAEALPPAPAATDQEAAASSALDKNVLREMLDIMGGDFGLLVRVYLEETPGRIAELESAAAAGNGAAVIAIAHTLKSSSANLGALTLAALARGIEEDLRASPTAPVVERVHQVRREYERAAAEFASLEADSL